jgi:RND family efflux transporter MFP subunit
MLCLALLLTPATATPGAGPHRVDGFTEPFRTVEVATTEVGIITALNVREGDRVSRGQVVATLDDDLQLAWLSIAEKNCALRGRLASAQAEQRLRAVRLEKLEPLERAGHARPEEVERARADLAIAEAQVLAAEEDLVIRQLEYSKTAIQLERRKIQAPLDGIVASVLKEPGEFVAPTDPYVLTVVQLDRLFAVFSIPSPQAESIQVGNDCRLLLAGQMVAGKVAQVAPLTDAESDTVRVKVRIDNAAGEYRSGQRCSLLLPEPP